MYDYDYYGSSLGTSNTLGTTAIETVLTAYMWAILLVYVIQVIGMWKTFTKAGQAGWKCLIPIYNLVILFRVAKISPWFVLGYLAGVIPVVGVFVVLALNIYLAINLSKAFGHGGGFAVGLFFLQSLFICILGFGKSEYQNNTQQPANTTSNN